MGQFGVKETQETIRKKLIDYIRAQYFGENKLLLNASDELLDPPGRVYQLPYIESTPSYEKRINGIADDEHIPEKLKQFLMGMINNNLGVFKNPFSHQIEAIDSFLQGKDLFVSTGTGSGKTECFMWPMLIALANEAFNNPSSWEQRGVRTLLVYPMNALVADQIGRLRKILGTDVFKQLFKTNAHSEIRTPQFGMYTGRTPYPGEDPNLKDYRKFAESLEKAYIVHENDDDPKRVQVAGLQRLHKIPAKYDLRYFVEQLKAGDVYNCTNPNDAELITRIEMQQHTPDILITNYSMLEYMLMRKIELNIWEDTKLWLNAAPENKLLIVIDEAHMYRGAAGGEVALLFRRLMAKLGISETKVRFILTTASMPRKENGGVDESVVAFASALTGKADAPNSFSYIFGTKDTSAVDHSVNSSSAALAEIDITSFKHTPTAIDEIIKSFARRIYSTELSNDNKPQEWLYDNLPRYIPFI